MTFKFRNLEKIVGFFILTGLIFLLVAVIFMGREQKWFENTVEFFTIFDDGESLSKGMSVKINGLSVGKITGVGFSTNDKIEVRFTVYSDFLSKINIDSCVFRESSSPLGGGHLALTIGGPGVRAATNGDYLASEDSPAVREMITKGLITKKGSLDEIIKSLNSLLAQLSSPQGPLIGALNNLETITFRIASEQGSLGALLADRAIYQELLTSLETVRRITEDMSIISGTLRTSSPNIQNIITGAEQGLNETTKVLVGLQRYFMIDSASRQGGIAPSEPMSTIRNDSRQNF